MGEAAEIDKISIRTYCVERLFSLSNEENWIELDQKVYSSHYSFQAL